MEEEPLWGLIALLTLLSIQDISPGFNSYGLYNVF